MAKEKRIGFILSEKLHRDIKANALHRNMTMTQYIKQAVDEMIARDNEIEGEKGE